MQGAKLPVLPGFSTGEVPHANHAKKQLLQFKNGYAVSADSGSAADAAAPAEALQAQLANWSIGSASGAAAATASEPFVPAYVALDKKVLRFMGWFGEAVHDNPLEAWRVRKVQVLVYLTDGTMQVVEPPQPNSGLPQGTLVRRHKLPREAAAGGGFLGPADLAVGGAVRIYGREVQLVDADAFTREHMAARGTTLAPAQAYPAAPIEEALKEKSKPSGLSRADEDSPSKFAEALLGKEANSKSLQQFLQHGHEVLRFYLLQEGPEPGDRRNYKMHFFVADNTGEIMEVPPPGTAVSLFPTFYKRGPLPRGVPAGALPGQARLAPEACYAPADLRVGATVGILGRTFLVHDCDAATRAWYTANLGLSAEELAPIPISAPAREAARPTLPPPNGFGSPEDSLQSCLRLVPKPPKKDQFRWQQLDHVVFRYEAVLEPPAGRTLISIDAGRRFVVSFWLADQTLAVFEPPQANTGITGGKFLERARIYKPGNDRLAWYTEADLAVGAVLDLHGRRFRITGVDAFTEQYRAQHV